MTRTLHRINFLWINLGTRSDKLALLCDSQRDMSQFLFIIILIVSQIIRGPISFLLIVLKNFSPALKKRMAFERLNFRQDECRSFKKDGLEADYCFEVSSEGELEQVRPLIENFLEKQKRIELLFASPSVEKKCLRLAQAYPQNLRVFRLPLVTHFFLFQTAHQFISAPKIIFCRYDFFPELLILKLFKKKFILLSGAAGKKPSWFKSQVYQWFDVIVAANAEEARLFVEQEKISVNKVLHFDFRIPRIFERVDHAPKVLSDIPSLQSYLLFLQASPRSKRLILGSAWESDLTIFKDSEWKSALRNGDLHLLVVPHDLSPTSIVSIKKDLAQIFPDTPIYEISRDHSQWNPEHPGIVVLNMSGVLCELYTFFDLSYVGGGFARSIHSVLEPFLAGAKVFCGPKVHRSTEYDFIYHTCRDEIQLLNNGDCFYTLFKDKAVTSPDQSVRQSLQQNAVHNFKIVLHEIEEC